MFNNFANFGWTQSFQRQHLTVIVKGPSKGRDNLGQPVFTEKVKKVYEQVVNNNNNNVTFVAADGGQYGVGTLIWQSQLPSVPDHSTVTLENGLSYETVSVGQDPMAGLFYYALKRIEVAHKNEREGI